MPFRLLNDNQRLVAIHQPQHGLSPFTKAVSAGGLSIVLIGSWFSHCALYHALSIAH